MQFHRYRPPSVLWAAPTPRQDPSTSISANAGRMREYEALRRRQLQTLDIVRDACTLFEALAEEDAMDEGCRVVFDFVSSIGTLLEEQIVAVDEFFEAGRRDRVEVLPGSMPLTP